MTDDKDQKPDERLPKRRDDSEKAIGLEMARLFGMNPKLMMAPKSPPQEPAESSESAEDDDANGEAGA